MRTRLVIAAIVTFLVFLEPAVQAQESKQTAGPTVKGDAAKPSGDGWKKLFDGISLDGWSRTKYARGGMVEINPMFRGGGAAIVVNAGGALSGFNWTGDAVPKTNYEIELEAMKIKGEDFMCGLTFPVSESHASLILGGWGGYITGISSLDNLDASENETQKSITYVKDRWYKVRMRVMSSRLQAWLDDKMILDVDTTGKKISLRIGEIEMSVPIGVSTYQTDAAFRAIKMRTLNPKEIAEANAKRP